MASAVSEKHMELAKTEVNAILRDAHRLQGDKENDFTVLDQSEINSMAGKITGTLTLLLGQSPGFHSWSEESVS